MRKKLSGIEGLDYTMGVIDGLEWCLNCGLVATADEICAQIRKLKSLQDDSLTKMEEDFNKREKQEVLNDTYNIIISQILETFPNACNIVRKGVFKESVVVEFAPFEGSTPYRATLFPDFDKVVIAVIL